MSTPAFYATVKVGLRGYALAEARYYARLAQRGSPALAAAYKLLSNYWRLRARSERGETT